MLSMVFALTLGSPQDAEKRFAQFVAQTPSFQVEVTNASRQNGLRATVTVVRGKQLRLEARYQKLRYSAQMTPKALLEMERSERVYDQIDLPETSSVGRWPSRISAIPGAVLPDPLFATKVSQLVPAPISVTPKNGGFELGGTGKTMEGTFNVTFQIDAQGRPQTYVVRSDGVQGQSIQRWEFGKFQKVPANFSFDLKIPDGFVPYSLNTPAMPPQKGETLDLKGWLLNGQKSPVDLRQVAGARPFLLALLGEGKPNASARKAIKELKGIRVFLLGSADAGAYQDPKKSRLARLRTLGTPMFYLVDKQGKVARLWFGFNARTAEAWKAEVLAEIAALTATPAGEDRPSL